MVATPLHNVYMAMLHAYMSMTLTTLETHITRYLIQSQCDGLSMIHLLSKQVVQIQLNSQGQFFGSVMMTKLQYQPEAIKTTRMRLPQIQRQHRLAQKPKPTQIVLLHTSARYMTLA